MDNSCCSSSIFIFNVFYLLHSRKVSERCVTCVMLQLFYSIYKSMEMEMEVEDQFIVPPLHFHLVFLIWLHSC